MNYAKITFVCMLVGLLGLMFASGTLASESVAQEEISQLITELQSANYGVSLQAQKKLAEIGEPAVPYLRIVLSRARGAHEKMKVIYPLGQIATENAIVAMLSMIDDQDEAVRNALISAFRGFDSAARAIAKPLVARHLVNPKQLARDMAVELLLAMDVSGEETAGLLFELVQIETGERQLYAIESLGRLGAEARVVVPELSKLIDPDNMDFTIVILKAISKIGGEHIEVALELMEDMLLSEDWDERQEAIWLLRELRLSGEQMIKPALALLASDQQAQQLHGIQVLGHLGITQQAAVIELINLVEDSTKPHYMRTAAFEALEPLVSQLEYQIDRGLVAVNTNDGVYVGWRLLGTDPKDLAFNLYRDGIKVNAEPIKTSTNFLDPDGKLDSNYYVRPILNGVELEPSETVSVWERNYHAVPLQVPVGGVTPDGVSYSYTANDASVADLDGDGKYEIVLKWDPTNSKDNSQRGYTGNVYIDAYKLDGTLMWRIDLGRNIRAGAHYTQFMVYDLDGDGRAEIVMKTADGTVDGTGKVIGNPNADYRNSSGYILSGPEYLTVFDGRTGAALATIDYEPPRGSVSSWGDSYGNRVDRFLAGIAYLDGVQPSVIMARGYYTRTVVVAYNWRGGKLTKLWTFDTNNPGLRSYEGQGNHQLSIGDVDGDGKDEIIFGAMTIDDDGSPLYNTGLGHGDALHVGDFDPERPGLEVFAVHENRPNPAGINFRDARTGEIIWGIPTTEDIGRGLTAKIDPTHPGNQMWASGGYPVMNIYGETVTGTRPSINFAIWWDGDLLRELLDNISITKWDWERKSIVQLLYADGSASNNGTKATPALTADLFGDWREEVIFRAANSRELRIYTTTDLTEHKLYTLMHDRMYRLAVAWQNVAYNQPPHPSFYIGPEMEPQTFNYGQIKVVLDRYRSELGL